MKLPKWLVIAVSVSLLLSIVNTWISLEIVSFLFGSSKVEKISTPPEPDYKRLIVARYKVDERFVDHVIDTVDRYTDETFPTKHDVVVIIGIESSFNPKAKSKLKRDAAVGLTQIRPKVWKHLIKNKKELDSVDGQIRYAVQILKMYYDIIGTKEGAILAYNNGLTAYMEGRYSTRYIEKFKRESANYWM